MQCFTVGPSSCMSGRILRVKLSTTAQELKLQIVMADCAAESACSLPNDADMRHAALQIMETQASLRKAQQEEIRSSANGLGPGSSRDVQRWTALKSIAEARAMLQTLFRAAAEFKAQVGTFLHTRMLVCSGRNETASSALLIVWHARALMQTQIARQRPVLVHRISDDLG